MAWKKEWSREIVVTEETVRDVVRWPLAMWWRDVAFFHWRVEPERLSASLPPEVEIDRFDGSAWLAVVPFRLTDVRLRGTPALPGFRSVPEINLRTYVTVRGEPGIWFFSLDATSRIVVDTARLATALPYRHARIATSEFDGRIRYESARHDRCTSGGRFRAEYAPSAAVRSAAPGSLDAFLHERYRFYSVLGGRLLTARVRHAPWSIQTLDANVAENSLGTLAGASLAGPPDLSTFGRAISVTASLTTPVSFAP